MLLVMAPKLETPLNSGRVFVALNFYIKNVDFLIKGQGRVYP